MPNFAGSKMQRVNKYAGLHAPQTPKPGLQPGLHCKTTLCFSASTCRQDSHTIHFAPAGNGLSPTAGRHLSGRFFTEHHTFRSPLPPARRQPANNLSPHIFSYQHHNPPPVNNLHSGLTGQYISALTFFFFLFLRPYTPHKKRKPAKPISISFFCNPESSPNLVQAFPSQSLSLPFSPSSQYTLPHRPRSGHT